VGIGICGTCCSKLNVSRQPGPNLWLSGKRPKNGPPVGFWRRAKKTLQSEVKKHVEAGSALYTDFLLSYDGLESDYAHQVIDHAVSYVEGNVHTNGLENYWSLLKRTISGTYVSVEPFHLFRYLDEQAFRYNNRKDMNDSDRFDLGVRQIVGKRLTWAEVTGKVEEIPIQTN
jgi:transposase-like protein